MALQNITNQLPKFRLHVDLEAEYATLRSMRMPLNISHDQLRGQGSKAIDLWTNGTLYPLDPIFGAPPPFRNIAMFVRFLGDGHNGLLGYCRRLHSLHLEELGRRKQVQDVFGRFQASTVEKIQSLTLTSDELKVQLQD